MEGLLHVLLHGGNQKGKHAEKQRSPQGGVRSPQSPDAPVIDCLSPWEKKGKSRTLPACHPRLSILFPWVPLSVVTWPLASCLQGYLGAGQGVFYFTSLFLLSQHLAWADLRWLREHII